MVVHIFSHIVTTEKKNPLHFAKIQTSIAQAAQR